MQPTDEILVKQYLEGREAALEELVQRHTGNVYNFVRRFVRTDQDTADVTQEVFIKMWRHIRKYDPAYQFKTWLFRIARNASLDHIRKRRDIPLSDFTDEAGENPLLDTLADRSPLPDELYAFAEEKERLARALREVKMLYREVLILRYEQHFSFAEISEILKRPLETVRSQHRRGLIMLREVLETQQRAS